MADKERWERHNRISGEGVVTGHIWVGDKHIADFENDADCKVAVALHNAAISINPSNKSFIPYGGGGGNERFI